MKKWCYLQVCANTNTSFSTLKPSKIIRFSVVMVLAANDVFIVVASTSTAREAAAPKARKSYCYFNADGWG